MRSQCLVGARTITTWIACASLLACGSTAATPDAGLPDASDDGSPPPTCPDAGVDPGLESANAPAGTQLVAGDDLSVRAVTSDGWLIYSDDAALTLHAIELAGGSTIDLGATGAKFWVTSAGNVVFVWSNVTADGAGALTVWTAASGAHALSSASLALVSATDGARVLYVDGSDVFAASIDGSGATKLVSHGAVAGCTPALAFAPSYALVTHCDVPPTSSPSATVSAFSTATWARTDLATGAENYFATAGANVLVSVDGAGVRVVPAAGGASVTVDSSGFLGVLVGGGATALYGTRSGELRRSPVTSPSPATLVASGFDGFWGLSPDEQWALYFSTVSPTGGDAYLASTTTAGAPRSVASSGAVLGAAFTASSSHALFTTDVDPCTGAGTLRAASVTGGAPSALGTNAWIAWSPSASKVVFADGFFPTNDARFGRADIELVDLAIGTSATRLVDRADAVLGLSPTGDRLVYAWSARPGALAGIWVAPLD